MGGDMRAMQWSVAQDKYIVQNYKVLPSSDIAAYLGRTVWAVQQRAHRLKKLGIDGVRPVAKPKRTISSKSEDRRFLSADRGWNDCPDSRNAACKAHLGDLIAAGHKPGKTEMKMKPSRHPPLMIRAVVSEASPVGSFAALCADVA